MFGCIKIQCKQIKLRLIFPQNSPTLNIIELFIIFRIRNIIKLTCFSIFCEFNSRIFQFLRCKLYEQLIRVVKCNFTPHLINFTLKNFRIHICSFSYQTKFFFFFQIVVNQTISSTFKRIISRIRPNRIFTAIKREEHVCNIFNVHCSFCEIALTGSFGGKT